MNERIQALAEHCDFYIGNEHHDKPREEQQRLFMEKFAELIVAECGNWFNDRLVVEPDYGLEHRIERNRAVVGVMKEFNQHFGVEE